MAFFGDLLLLLLTALARVMWLSLVPSSPSAPVDAEGFHLLAVNLLAGRGPAFGWHAPFCPTAIRPPLYPLFLAGGYSLLGQNPAAVVLLQVLLEVLTTAGVIRLGRTVGGRRVGSLAGLLYALNGSTQRYTGYLLAESLLLPLMTGALWATISGLRRPSAARLAWAGGLWGLAILVKPNVQYLAWGLAGYALLTRRRAALFFPLMLLLVLAPWVVRNRLVLGRWLISTAFEENTARISAVATMAQVQGVTSLPWTETWEAEYRQLVAETARHYAWGSVSEADGTCAEQARRHHQVALTARQVLRRHPGAWLTAHFGGVLHSVVDVEPWLWYPLLGGPAWASLPVVPDIWVRMAWSLRRGAVGDALRVLWQERVLRLPPQAALLWWGLLLARLTVWVLGVRGAWRLRDAARAVLVGTVIYVLMLPGPVAYDRFYLPAIPAVVVLMAVGWFNKARSKKPMTRRSYSAG